MKKDVSILRMRTRTAVLLLAVLSFSAITVFADSADFTVKKVGDGVYAAIGADGGKAGSNAGFIVGSNGVVVMDTFEEVAPARDLLAEIRKITNLPIRLSSIRITTWTTPAGMLSLPRPELPFWRNATFAAGCGQKI